MAGAGPALGLAVLGTGVLGAGLTGLLVAPPRAATLAGLTAVGAVFLVRRRKQLRGAVSAPWFPDLPRPVAVVLLAALAMALVGVLNLEMAWDALSYHLRLPTFYAYRHKIYDVWHHYCAPFPSLVEMLYLLAQLVHGDTLARLVNAGCGLTLLPATAALARGLGLPGGPATALLAASPTFILLLDRAYIDPGFALFTTWSLALLVRGLRGRSPAALAASGLLAGAAMGSKYVGILLLPAAVLAAWPALWTARGAAGAALWCAAGAAPLLPWLAKNVLFRANPVSPLLGGFFGTHESIPPDVTPLFSGADPLARLAASLPARAIAMLYDNGRIDGPLAAAVYGLFPLLLITRLADPPRAALRRAVLGWTGAWFVLAPDARFFFPILPAACVALEAAWRPGRASRLLFAGALLTGAAHAAMILWIFFAPFALVLGLDSAEPRHALSLPPPPFTSYMKNWVNAHTPPDARIWYMSNFSTYYVERECLAEFHFGQSQFVRLAADHPTAEAMAKRFRQLGFSYLLSTGTVAQQYLETPGPHYFALPDATWREFKRLLATRATAVWQTESYTLYRLGRPHAARPLPDLPLYEAIAFRQPDKDLTEGRFAEAMKGFLAAPPLLADVGSTFVRQGDTWLVLGELRRSEVAFRRALALGADNPRVRVGLGEALIRQGRAAEALPHHEAGWTQNPRSAFAAAALALNYIHLRRPDDARRLIREAVRLRPDDADYRRIAAELGEKL